MQRRDLPSLDLLKGFEAAARSLSFTKAAAELFVTQSAISRQVKTLEDQIGAELFQRRHRELLLTEAGQSLYKTAAEVLRLLRDATDRLQAVRRGMLTVATTVSFASLWLVPKLAGFRRLHPEIDVRISADNEIRDMDRDGIDLAIRYCTRKAAGDGAVRLFGERVFPVCAKNLVAAGELESPEDLSRHVLLHLDDERRWPWLAWDVWFELIRAPSVKPAGVLRFSHYDQLVHAALDGQGIALGRSPLVDRWVREGRLVPPFGKRFMSPLDESRAYFIVVPPGPEPRSGVGEFSKWMQQEAQADADSPPPKAARKRPTRPARKGE